MIVLDTNVVSEVMKLDAAANVLGWLTFQAPDDLYVSAVTVAELFAGIERMPVGRRRDDTEARARRVLALFGPVIVPFTDVAAEYCGAILAVNDQIDVFDAQIAAIAQAHQASIATRNVKHFERLGLDLINPWAA